MLAIPYVLGSRDVALPRALRPDFSWPEFLRSFWISPRRHPDFAWAWLTRFLVNLGNSLGTLLLYFYLQDAVDYPDPELGVLVLTVVYAVFIVASTVVVRALVRPAAAPQDLRRRLRARSPAWAR